MATSRNATPRYWFTKLPWTPNLSSVSRSDFGAAAAVTLEITPSIKPEAKAPTHQATSTGASRRTFMPNADAKPNGPEAARRRVTRGTPSPTSRRDAITTATVAKTSTEITAGTSGRRSFSVNGCIRSVQPNGVVHKSQRVPGPESAIIRSTNITPKTRMPKPVAARRVRHSCDVTAPTAPNTAARYDDTHAEQHGSVHAERDIVVTTGQEREQCRAGEDHADRRTERHERRGRRSRRAGTAGQHELPATGILLAPQQPSRREERPDRSDRGEEHEDLVDGVPTDGADGRHRTEQDRKPGVATGGHRDLPAAQPRSGTS